MASTGCTAQQAWAEWDIPSITTQATYWHRHPPVHLLLAAYIGYEPPAKLAATRAQTQASLDALVASAPDLPEHLKLPFPKAPQQHG